MERAPRRPVKAHEGAPSRLVDPRRSGAVTRRPEGHGSNSARARVVAGVTRPTHCLTTGGPCGRIILDLRRPMPGQSQPVRGAHALASSRADLAHGRVDRTTRRRTSSAAGNYSRVPQPERSRARPHENPQSKGTRGAADRAVERFLGPTVEKITRVALASRAGLRRDTPCRRSWRHSTAWKDATDSIPHSSPLSDGSRSLGPNRAYGRPHREPRPSTRGDPPGRHRSAKSQDAKHGPIESD